MFNQVLNHPESWPCTFCRTHTSCESSLVLYMSCEFCSVTLPTVEDYVKHRLVSTRPLNLQTACAKTAVSKLVDSPDWNLTNTGEVLNAELAPGLNKIIVDLFFGMMPRFDASDVNVNFQEWRIPEDYDYPHIFLVELNHKCSRSCMLARTFGDLHVW